VSYTTTATLGGFLLRLAYLLLPPSFSQEKVEKKRN